MIRLMDVMMTILVERVMIGWVDRCVNSGGGGVFLTKSRVIKLRER